MDKRMENDLFNLDDLRKRLVSLPDVDLDLMADGKPPRLSTLQIKEMQIPKFLKDKILDTMGKHGIDHLFQWILYSLIITGLYDDCIDFRLIPILKKQWQVDEAKSMGKQQL